jgi:hypothetical protein
MFLALHTLQCYYKNPNPSVVRSSMHACVLLFLPVAAFLMHSFLPKIAFPSTLAYFQRSSIKILTCIKFLLILCFHQKRLNNLTPSSVPPRRNFYFDDSDYCREILMFFNPCYDHDNHVPDRKVPGDDNNLFDEFMDHPSKVQTLNPKSDSINTFISTDNASIGWHVLEVGG